jgi:hypothetical protein
MGGRCKQKWVLNIFEERRKGWDIKNDLPLAFAPPCEIIL